MASPAETGSAESEPADTGTETLVAPASLTVEVAYALPDRQTLLTLSVPDGSTVAAVIRQSGLLQRHPEIDLDQQPVGIWARPVPLQQPVAAGDRIEIYRPLTVDPSTTLRQREQAKRRQRR